MSEEHEEDPQEETTEEPQSDEVFLEEDEQPEDFKKLFIAGAIIILMVVIGIIGLIIVVISPPAEPEKKARVLTTTTGRAAIPEDAMGVLSLGGKTYAARDTISRLISERYLSDNLPKKEEEALVLEISLFENPLTKEERNRFNHAAMFSREHFKKFPQYPLLVLQLHYLSGQQPCNLRNAQGGKVFVREIAGDTTNPPFYSSRTIEPTLLERQGDLKAYCETLQPGAKLSLTYLASESVAGSTQTSGWDIAVNDTFQMVTPYQTISFREFEDMVALWNPIEEILTVGFYHEYVDKEGRASIKSSQALSGATGVSPFFLVSIPVPRTVLQLGRKKVKGHSILVFPNQRQRLGLGEELQILDFKMGREKPYSIAGNLEEGSTVHLTVKGRKVISLEAGMILTDWNLSGKSKVLVAMGNNE